MNPPRLELAASDERQQFLAQPVPAPVAPQRPGLGARTSSAPSGELYKLDSGRKPPPSPGLNLPSMTEMIEKQGPSSAAWPRSHGDEEPPHTGLPEVTIAVVGEDNAGKSSFIKCALDMKQPSSSILTKKKMSLDGSIYAVGLLEIDLKQVIFEGHNVMWPRVGNDKSVPIIDGVLLLHDSTQPDKVDVTTELAGKLSLEVAIDHIILPLPTNLWIDLDALGTSIPFLLVACKCDLRPEDSDLGVSNDRHHIYRTSPDSPRSQQMCIALVLRSVILSRKGIYFLFNSLFLTSPMSPRFCSGLVTSDHIYNPPNPSPRSPSFLPHPTQGIHSRANPQSPFINPGAAGGSLTGLALSEADDRDKPKPPSLNLAQQQHVPSARNARRDSRPQTPPSGARLNQRRPSAQGSAQGDSPPLKDYNLRPQNNWRHSGDAFDTFLNMDDEMDDGQPVSPTSAVRTKPSSESSSSADVGISFDELVDRLVAVPLSKQDSKFVAIFLCLYRKFAAPSTLLNALIIRFEKNEISNEDQLARMANQLRLLNVIAIWAADYPGDFAFPRTRKRINDFVCTLEKSHFYMFAAKEIGSFLEPNAEDDDMGWAFRDGEDDDSAPTETFFDNSGRSSPAPFLTGSYNDEDEAEEDPLYSMNALDLSDGPHDRLSRTFSVTSTTDKPSSTLNQSFTVLTLEASQKEANRLELTCRTPLTKVQWRTFMDIPEEDFARELTRIDWIEYNSFRPRDLVRHVSISGVDKEKIKSLENVNRMIKQFNHLAFFVASMILLRDKPKHRARCLEKFMGIAVKLRRQNNYNSLGAVIAAINGTPVHRLTQTKDLIPIPTQKEFMRLVILMSTQRSHFAYRLAWENSFSERIPFIPLHRRDLVSAEEGNKTFYGENKSRINWKKFEVMGEVVLGIQRSQKTPHPQAQKFEEIERLVLDAKLSGDEEDLYARSLLVEPSTSGEPLPGHKCSTPSPLHRRLRELFRAEQTSTSTLLSEITSTSTSSSSSESAVPKPFSVPSTAEEYTIRIQEAEQLAQYAKAQRTYSLLLERYNNGMNMDEEERIRLTARRVGFDLPELHDPNAKED
ncbi:hypothetical protein N7495_005100 [Penicillium taxi]|uniref:uncharacterized protein n=1 Tax=Penicillium taxi TaxID=168475 RepID=UPI0025454443|nr:uncharacterized protein N7495_005100 [Penicillium taxi]KAJ5893409.1 hypothetical protein N7495_005100 [Penicillium taxi]